jgi:PAS domain-containing protein
MGGMSAYHRWTKGAWMEPNVERIRRLLGLTPFSWAVLSPVWIGFLLIFYFGLVRGINLGPLGLVPVLATAFGRRPAMGAAAGMLMVPLLIAIDAAAGTESPITPVLVGSAMLTLLGILESNTSLLAAKLVSLTDKARSEQERANETHKVYRSLYDGIPVGLWRTKPDGAIVEVNPAFAAYLGYEMDELMRLNAYDLYMNRSDRTSFSKLCSGATNSVAPAIH